MNHYGETDDVRVKHPYVGPIEEDNSIIFHKSSYKGGSERSFPTGTTLSTNKTQKSSIDHFNNDHNQSTDDTGKIFILF